MMSHKGVLAGWINNKPTIHNRRLPQIPLLMNRTWWKFFQLSRHGNTRKATSQQDRKLLPPNEEEMNKEMPCEFSCCWHESHNANVQTNSLEKQMPMSIAIVRKIQNHASNWSLWVLFDLGGTTTTFHCRVLPRGCAPSVLKQPLQSTTVQGTFFLKQKVQSTSISCRSLTRVCRWTNNLL